MESVWNLARARWLLLIAGVLLGAIGGAVYSGTITVDHRSTAVVYFAVDRAKTASDYTAGSSFAQSVMPSFAQIVKSPIVLDPVIEELDLQTTARNLAGRIQVDVPSNTTVMNVTVTDTSSLRAAMTANAVSLEDRQHLTVDQAAAIDRTPHFVIGVISIYGRSLINRSVIRLRP